MRKKIFLGGEIALKYDTEIPKGHSNIWARKDLQPNKMIQEIYADGTIIINKKKEKLTSAISPVEGFHLYNVITLNKFIHILEVGMANGLSSLYITQALNDNKNNGKLISIDPFQTSQWKSVGINHIKQAGLSEFHQLYKEKDYIALPKLLSERSAGSFDMVFIDGMHLFDYTLLDMFYAILLCRIGGVIIVDDILHDAPAKCIKYFDTNYKFLKRVQNIPCKTVATYIKISDDMRSWDFHVNF
jgi:predicted O-methyltransferase YrrM